MKVYTQMEVRLNREIINMNNEYNVERDFLQVKLLLTIF